MIVTDAEHDSLLVVLVRGGPHHDRPTFATAGDDTRWTREAGEPLEEDEPIRASTLKRLSKADAKRLARQIERLPDLLVELKLHRAARDQPA
jgi:hypothetical protein